MAKIIAVYDDTATQFEPAASTFKIKAANIELSANSPSFLRADGAGALEAIGITSGALNANNDLVLNKNDGGVVIVPMGSLAGTSVQSTQTANFSGSGTPASPLKVDVKVSTTANNALTQDANGLFVSVYPKSTDITTTIAPASSASSSLTTSVVGDRTKLLGLPSAWVTSGLAPDGKKYLVPLYKEA
jgi:hypothetical protein